MGHLREGAWISAQAGRWSFIDGHADWAKRHGNMAIIGLPDAVRDGISWEGLNMQSMDASDEQLWEACRRLPSDFEPHGERQWHGRREDRPDCATCCWFMELFRTWPDWGTCANPNSLRAGLLTFWEQGCWQHEPEKGHRHEETRRARCDFRNSFENMLREQWGDFIREEVQKVNDPLAEEEAAAPRTEDIRESPLFIILRRLLRHADEDFRRQAVDEMAARARWEGSRYWEYARRFWARTVGEGVSEIRLPENMGKLEEEFWGRVDAAIREAFEGRGSRPTERKRRRAG